MAVDPAHQAPWERSASADDGAERSADGYGDGYGDGYEEEGGSAASGGGGGGGFGGGADRARAHHEASVAPAPPPSDGAPPRFPRPEASPRIQLGHSSHHSLHSRGHSTPLPASRLRPADIDRFPGLAALEAQFRATLGALQSGAERLSAMPLSPTAPAPPPQPPPHPQPPPQPHSQPAQPPQQQPPRAPPAADTPPDPQQPDPKAVAWAKANPWFGNDSEMTEFAYKVHDELVGQQGMDPASDAYYAALDSCVQARFPGGGGAPPPAPLPPRWAAPKQGGGLGAPGPRPCPQRRWVDLVSCAWQWRPAAPAARRRGRRSRREACAEPFAFFRVSSAPPAQAPGSSTLGRTRRRGAAPPSGAPARRPGRCPLGPAAGRRRAPRRAAGAGSAPRGAARGSPPQRRSWCAPLPRLGRFPCFFPSYRAECGQRKAAQRANKHILALRRSERTPPASSPPRWPQGSSLSSAAARQETLQERRAAIFRELQAAKADVEAEHRRLMERKNRATLLAARKN